MKLSGIVQLGIWRARLQLRKSALLRRAVQIIRGLAPDTRDRHLRTEVKYWRRWALTEGLHWQDDFKMRFDPEAPVQDHVARIIDRIDKTKVEILDIGAGPATVLGKKHPSKQLVITPTDPLAREYAAILAECEKKPPIPTIYAEAESLREQLGARTFDIVHAQNSLDHSRDPLTGIEEMLATTRPGGFIILLHEENEGSNELYYALHKWDFRCEEGRFIVAGPGPNGPRRDVTEMIGDRGEVECSMHDGEVLVVIHKAQKQKSNSRSKTAMDAVGGPS